MSGIEEIEWEWKVMGVFEERVRETNIYIPSRHYLSSPLWSHPLAV